MSKDGIDLGGFHRSGIVRTYEGSYGESSFTRTELEEVATEYAAAIDYAFNPSDGDGSQESLLVGAMLKAADWIEQQPCQCTPAMVDDFDPCGRCRVLGRIGDQRQDQ